MNRERDFEQTLQVWFDDGVDQAPERFVWAALEEVDRTPQRGAWRASLEGLIMRLQPAAPILGIAAVVVAALAVYVAFAGRNVGEPDGSTGPKTTFATNAYASTEFAVPMRLTLPSAASPDGWHIAESAAMLTFSPEEGIQHQGVLFVAGRTQVVESDGQPASLPADLVAWLDDQPGIAAGPLEAFDVAGQEAIVVLGEERPVFIVEVDPSAAGERELLRTTGGDSLAVADAPSTWWLVSFPAGGQQLGLILATPTEAEVNWMGSFLSIAESIELR